MKISKLSLTGMIFGGIFAISSWLRYFVLYPDLDRALVYGLLGVVIIAISYFYSLIVNLTNTLYDVEVYLADNNLNIKEVKKWKHKI